MEELIDALYENGEDMYCLTYCDAFSGVANEDTMEGVSRLVSNYVDENGDVLVIGDAFVLHRELNLQDPASIFDSADFADYVKHIIGKLNGVDPEALINKSLA